MSPDCLVHTNKQPHEDSRTDELLARIFFTKNALLHTVVGAISTTWTSVQSLIDPGKYA